MLNFERFNITGKADFNNNKGKKEIDHG